MTITAARSPEEAPAEGSARLTSTRLLRGLGGGRYAAATVVSSLGGGLIRPFLLLYAVTVSHLSASSAGVALSIGFLAGLLTVPLAGRWVDRGSCRAVMVLSLFLRGCGLVALLALPGATGFVICCVLQGIGNQSGPVGQAAVVANFATGRDRDAVLATLRSLANGGLGVGAMVATVIVSTGGIRWLAVGTAAGYLAAAALVAGVPITGTGPSAEATGVTTPTIDDRFVLRRLALLNLANLPFAFCFDVLEVALPVVLVLQVHAAAGWSSGIFMVNTAMVVLVQLPVVMWLSRFPRRRSFAIAGWVLAISYLGFLLAGEGHGAGGAMAIALVSLLYNLGEMSYTGVGTALVVDAAPARLRGRVLARWQLSLGLGRALAPLAITAALTVSAAALWLPLAALTVLGAGLISRFAPGDGGATGRSDSDRRAVRRQRVRDRAIAESTLRRSGYWEEQDRRRWPAPRGPRPFR